MLRAVAEHLDQTGGHLDDYRDLDPKLTVNCSSHDISPVLPQLPGEAYIMGPVNQVVDSITALTRKHYHQGWLDGKAAAK